MIEFLNKFFVKNIKTRGKIRLTFLTNKILSIILLWILYDNLINFEFGRSNTERFQFLKESIIPKYVNA